MFLLTSISMSWLEFRSSFSSNGFFVTSIVLNSIAPRFRYFKTAFLLTSTDWILLLDRFNVSRLDSLDTSIDLILFPATLSIWSDVAPSIFNTDMALSSAISVLRPVSPVISSSLIPPSPPDSM